MRQSKPEAVHLAAEDRLGSIPAVHLVAVILGQATLAAPHPVAPTIRSTRNSPLGTSLALVHFDGLEAMVGCPSISLAQALPMPHKHNAARRHHIPKMSFKVQNRPAYEAGLRQRGSLTLWIEDGALEDWQGSVRDRAIEVD
jgi:hypothetical protein